MVINKLISECGKKIDSKLVSVYHPYSKGLETISWLQQKKKRIIRKK